MVWGRTKSQNSCSVYRSIGSGMVPWPPECSGCLTLSLQGLPVYERTHRHTEAIVQIKNYFPVSLDTDWSAVFNVFNCIRRQQIHLIYFCTSLYLGMTYTAQLSGCEVVSATGQPFCLTCKMSGWYYMQICVWQVALLIDNVGRLDSCWGEVLAPIVA